MDFEIFRMLSLKPLRKKGWYVLKRDRSNAYDKVERDLLKSIMQMMEFPLKFVDLIMNRVSTVSYSVILNGDLLSSCRAAHGLRQGDRLLAYLFVLCAEVISFIF